MALIRIAYIALLVATGMFFILYLDPLSLILFLVVAVLPVFLFIITLIARLSITISVEANNTAATKGEEALLYFTVNNRSFISLKNLKASITVKNGFLGETQERELFMPAPALTKQTIKYAVKSEHIGKVKIGVKDIILYDYFKLFSFKIKLNKNFDISFLPEILPTPINLRVNSFINNESDVFSKQKAGDDPSEIFKIRDFVGGDKLNRIHWKLTTKTGNLMVKEFSLPINTSIMIALELNANIEKDGYLDYLDTAIESAVCISSYLAESNIRHYISWYDANTQILFKEDIKNKDDLYTALAFILSSKGYNCCATLEQIKNSSNEYSHIAYCTCNTLGVEEIIRNMGSLSFITVLEALKENDQQTSSIKGAGVLPIINNKTAECIINAVL